MRGLALFFRYRQRGGSVKALQEGAYINHFGYGLGIVAESDSGRTSIDFDLYGMKKFATSIMFVEPAEATPLKRSRRRKKPSVTSAKAGAK